MTFYQAKNAVQCANIFEDTETGYRRSCWFSHGALLLVILALIIDVLHAPAVGSMTALMMFSAFQTHRTIGTLYQNQFRNLFICIAVAFWIISATWILLPTTDGLISWALHTLLFCAATFVAFSLIVGLSCLAREVELPSLLRERRTRTEPEHSGPHLHGD